MSEEITHFFRPSRARQSSVMAGNVIPVTPFTVREASRLFSRASRATVCSSSTVPLCRCSARDSRQSLQFVTQSGVRTSHSMFRFLSAFFRLFQALSSCSKEKLSSRRQRHALRFSCYLMFPFCAGTPFAFVRERSRSFALFFTPRRPPGYSSFLIPNSHFL